jgi:hypothetical protein
VGLRTPLLRAALCGTPEDFGVYCIKADMPKWTKVIKAAQIKVD